MTHSPHSSLVKTCGSDMQNTYKYQLYYMQSYCTVHTILIANFLKWTYKPYLCFQVELLPYHCCFGIQFAESKYWRIAKSSASLKHIEACR